jgi:hypothetical protein
LITLRLEGGALREAKVEVSTGLSYGEFVALLEAEFPRCLRAVVTATSHVWHVEKGHSLAFQRLADDESGKGALECGRAVPHPVPAREDGPPPEPVSVPADGSAADAAGCRARAVETRVPYAMVVEEGGQGRADESRQGRQAGAPSATKLPNRRRAQGTGRKGAENGA